VFRRDTCRVRAGPPLRDVDCFALVARHRSFSRAAAALGQSQPSMSQAIGRLERTLGVRLFDRTNRAVRLTTAGAALLPYAEAVLAAVEAMAAEAARQAEPDRATIRLAYPPLVGTLAARIARRVGRGRPPVDVALAPMSRTAALAALAAGEVPAAILRAPFPAGLASTARFQVRIGHLAVPAGDALAGLAAVRPDQIGRRRLLLPGVRTPGGPWARLAAQVRPHQIRVVDDDLEDLAVALDLVAAGAGVLPAPRLLVDAVRRPDIQFVPLAAGDLRLAYALLWPAGAATPELMALISAVQQALRTR
jgi:DNA-binding transcriptional LysR family regulator